MAPATRWHNVASQPREPGQAAKAAMAQVLRERSEDAAALDAEIVALIDETIRQMLAELVRAPSDYQQWVLPRMLASVQRLADEMGANLEPQLQAALQAAMAQGERAVTEPVIAAQQAESAEGVVSGSPILQLQGPDLRQLRAMQAFSTSRIQDATADMVRAVNRELGRVMIGGQTPYQALQAVREVLPDRTKVQVRTIVNSNLAAAFNTASFAALQRQAARDPEIKKQWRRSGKMRARWNHAEADGQVQDVDKPFVLHAHNRKGTVSLMHPADPGAPLGEILNCGCVALAWKKSWRMRTPAKLPGKGPA